MFVIDDLSDGGRGAVELVRQFLLGRSVPALPPTRVGIRSHAEFIVSELLDAAHVVGPAAEDFCDFLLGVGDALGFAEVLGVFDGSEDLTLQWRF